LRWRRTLSCDLDLVHATTSDVVPETNPVAPLSVSARRSQRLHEIDVFEDVEGFFEGLEIVVVQEDERGSSIASDQDTVMLTLDPIGKFRCALTSENGSVSLIWIP
jgi:hypothetical protein